MEILFLVLSFIGIYACSFFSCLLIACLLIMNKQDDLLHKRQHREGTKNGENNRTVH